MMGLVGRDKSCQRPLGLTAQARCRREIQVGPDRRLEVVRFEAGWPWTALEGNTALRVDEIEPVRQGRVGCIDAIIHVVDEGRDVNIEAERAGLRDLDALFVGGGLGEEDALLDVALNLPAVRGMGLTNVDDIEGYVVAVALVDFLQADRLVAERRSGVGAEYQANGPAS